jgi:hypothetical protein
MTPAVNPDSRAKIAARLQADKLRAGAAKIERDAPAWASRMRREANRMEADMQGAGRDSNPQTPIPGGSASAHLLGHTAPDSNPAPGTLTASITPHETALAIAVSALRRLADPTEIAGFADADEPPNDFPEMRARLKMASRALDEVRETLTTGWRP